MRPIRNDSSREPSQSRRQAAFTFITFESGDGAVLGTHPVTVIAMEPLGDTRQRWHAPKKYINPETSGLTATIDGPTDSLLIELTWDGGKPFVETLR